MQKEPRRLSVLGQGEEIATPGVQEGIGGGRGRGQDDGIDDRRKNRDTGTVYGDNPRGSGRAGCASRLGVQQALVVVWDEDTDGERAQDVKEQDAPEDTTDGLGDILPRVLGFTRSHGDHLDAAVREGGVHQSREQTQKPAGIPGSDVRFHRPGILPVPESQAIVRRPSAKVEDQSQQEQTDDGDDLDASEAEFGFTIDRHGEDVEAHDHNDDDGNPCGNVDVLGTRPELDDDGRRGNLGAECDGTRIPILLPCQMMDGPRGSEMHIRSNPQQTPWRRRRTERRIEGQHREEAARWPFLPVTASVVRHTLSAFRTTNKSDDAMPIKKAEGVYHCEDSNTSQGITEQDTQRSSLSEGPPDPQEQAGADGAAESDELDVTRFQPWRERSAEAPARRVQLLPNER